MSQLASSILMVRPASFGFNAETAANNAFQQKQSESTSINIAEKAIEEFDAMVKLLCEKDIDITVIQDTQKPEKPDAVFPNNWFCTLPGGKLIVFPMFAENRRIEKQNPVLQSIRNEFIIVEERDWSEYEKENIFLEGTGSMIFDHENKIVYACISERTDKKIFEKFADTYGYKPISFLSVDENGTPIYHTNVMMHMGENYVVICLDSIPYEAEQKEIISCLQNTHHELIDISQEQVKKFAGNMIQVKNKSDEKFTVLSRTAFDALTEKQKSILSLHTQLLPVNIPTIESIGGGSARCMIAELFLERKI
ncbi:MAG: arginine deiminase-related protein [Arachidicoccus sp.]|nr:arginine deiminase-related protein [Arachidicoccus sp.]